MTPKLIRPTQAASIPVIQPIEQEETQNIPAVPPVDCAKVFCLALTFDDGPDKQNTPKVLNILKKHNVKATFFLVGSRVAGKEHLVRRIHQEGHQIGNHTWSHRQLPDLSPREVKSEVDRTQSSITSAGVPAPSLFRPPYGALNPMARSHIPMTVVAWNIDPEDWRASEPEDITDHILENAKPGAIVDLHDTSDVTVEALGKLLAKLQKKYHLVTVGELLNLPPGQPGVFYSRQ